MVEYAVGYLEGSVRSGIGSGLVVHRVDGFFPE